MFHKKIHGAIIKSMLTNHNIYFYAILLRAP